MSLAFDRRELEASWFRGGGGNRSEPPADPDYLLHCRLAALFGDFAPRPFVSRWRRHRVEVEAYGRLDTKALLAAAESSGTPARWRPINVSSGPVQVGEGEFLRFALRTCPVVRLASASGSRRRGAEMDVFERERPDPRRGLEKAERGEVYGTWLRARLRNRGVEVLEVRLELFRLRPLLRRTQRSSWARKGRRRARHLLRPDATLAGIARVVDLEAAIGLLERGVGRHRAFGFGLFRILGPVSTPLSPAAGSMKRDRPDPSGRGPRADSDPDDRNREERSLAVLGDT